MDRGKPGKPGGETGDGKPGKPGTDGTFSGFLRRNRKTFRLSPVSVQAIDGAGGGPAVHGQREVAAFPARQRLGRQRGGLLDGERAAVQRDGALPAFAGELQRTAVLADLDRG